MNEKKLQQLLAAARREPGPAAPEDFAAGVLRQLRREPSGRPETTPGLLDHLSEWFPRLATVAVGLILLFGVADRLTENWLPADGGDAAAQFSSAYLTDGEEP